jgi:hypothetical protein
MFHGRSFSLMNKAIVLHLRRKPQGTPTDACAYQPFFSGSIGSHALVCQNNLTALQANTFLDKMSSSYSTTASVAEANPIWKGYGMERNNEDFPGAGIP